MRSTLLLPIAMCCAAFALPANALVAVDLPAAKLEKPIVTVAAHHHCKVGDTCDSAAHCPPGTRWVPAKYGRAGKWRLSHCSNWVYRPSPTDTVANQLNTQESAQHQGGMMPPTPGYR
jgi:hypothetical protein